MAEHGDRAHNGNGPFRRYSPPAHSSNGNGRMQPPPQPGFPLDRDSRATRTARRRWRQWVQPRPDKTPDPAMRPSPPAAGSPQGGPPPGARPPAAAAPQRDPAGTYPTPSPYYRGTAPSQPGRPPAIPQPSPLVTGNLPGPPPSQEEDRRSPDQRGRRSEARPRGRTGGAARSPRPEAVSNRANAAHSKVTPLRRQPAWTTPNGDEGGSSRPRPPRRTRQRAPRPVLYGVRLLILGVGMAAIAGTLLSVLNPEKQVGGTNPTDTPATPVANPNPRAQGAGTVPNLSGGEELTYLEADLLELEGLAPGLTQSTFMLDLDTGNYVDINGDTAVAAASTIKVPILVAFFEAVDAGRITLDQGVTLTEPSIVGGSGEMQTDPVGTRYTAYEVATAMIINSDNTATELMISLLGGPSALNQTFQAWGLNATVIRNPLPDLEGTNTTSPKDLARVMTLVEQGEMLSLRSRDRLLSIMQRTYARDLIPAGIGEDAIVFNKTGDIGALLGDVALVEAPNGKRYVFAVLVERPHNDGRAAELIRRIAEAIHGEMNQPIAPVGGDITPTTATETPEATTDPAPDPGDSGAEPEMPPG